MNFEQTCKHFNHGANTLYYNTRATTNTFSTHLQTCDILHKIHYHFIGGIEWEYNIAKNLHVWR